MRLHWTAFGVCLFACSMLYGQTVSISDDSPAGSPVSLSGTVTFPEPSKADCSITGYNHTSKSIILSVVEMKLTKPSGEPVQTAFTRDTFFRPQPISLPESDFPIESYCETGGTEQVKINGKWVDIPRTPTTPEAHAKVVFLQFEDGSIWGDPTAGERLITRRPAVLASLISLKTMYSTEGAEALANAIAQKQKPGGMVTLLYAKLRMIRDTSGIGAVAETIDQYLATAERRKAFLK